jgi:4-hydroxy-3-polyprenylbenzoate decarboxylase
VVSVKAPYANVADDIAHVIWGTKAGRPVSYLIIVDEDVNPFNMNQVLHALATKCHPKRGIVKLERTIGMALNPWANEHEQEFRMGAKVYFDCTWPLDWDPLKIPKRISFAEAYPLEVQEEALTKWHKYGY